MFKVTLIFISILLFSCNLAEPEDNLDKFEQQLNKDAEKRLDAAYISITKHCDSVLIYELPLKVDSIIKTGNVK
ncbi:MAG: hypothetical protein ABIN36_11140 [Ferruginibacter sp.]